MSVVFGVCAAMLGVAAVLVLVRTERGPSVLDRVVALDVFVATLLAAFAFFSAWSGRRDLTSVMVVLSLVGFVGAVSIARFAATETADEGRILTRAEIAEIAAREESEGER